MVDEGLMMIVLMINSLFMQKGILLSRGGGVDQ